MKLIVLLGKLSPERRVVESLEFSQLSYLGVHMCVRACVRVFVCMCLCACVRAFVCMCACFCPWEQFGIGNKMMKEAIRINF